MNRNKTAKARKSLPNDKVGKLVSFINTLSKDNKEMIVDIFYDVAKIISRKKEKTQKPTLKRKEITNILQVIDFHYRKRKRFEMDKLGNTPLGHFFNREVNEGDALEYLQKELQEKEIKDKYGRRIIFTEEGMKFLYKDEQGNHTIDSKNYVPLRGKRLPWIANTINKTDEIYEIPSNIPQKPVQFMYSASYCFKFTNVKGEIEEKTEFFIVFVSLIDGVLKFDSAYPVTYDEHLKRLEQCCLFK